MCIIVHDKPPVQRIFDRRAQYSPEAFYPADSLVRKGQTPDIHGAQEPLPGTPLNPPQAVRPLANPVA